MPDDIPSHLDQHLRLYADCILVSGATRSAICDLTRHEIVLCPAPFGQLLDRMATNSIRAILAEIESESETNKVRAFITFLLTNELASFTLSPLLFPAISRTWQSNSAIQNAVVDMRDSVHDLDTIFFQLDQLGCKHVQIRCFSAAISLDLLDSGIAFAKHKSIESVELLVAYRSECTDEIVIAFMRKHPIVVDLTIHSSPSPKSLRVHNSSDLTGFAPREVSFVTQIIDSANHCGVITLKTLNAPSASNFFELKQYNGCLNGKVSVDVNGQVKNCPSMKLSYGSIHHISLPIAVETQGFKKMWAYNKDQIDVCCDCEFRYVCSDCRAYVENPANDFSKPLKCGYDPYRGIWEELSQNPLKKMARDYYAGDISVIT